MNFTKQELNLWKLNPLINPKTKRSIKLNGPTFNLLKQQYNNQVNYGYYNLIMKNEDRFILKQDKNYIYAGVYDGHGNSNVSTFFSNNFISTFIKSKIKDIPNKLIKSYIDIDTYLKYKNVSGGSTASTIIFNKNINKFWIANTGDSRIIAMTKSNKIKQLTRDHKPHLKYELARIHNNNEQISFNGVYRIGSLAVSRVIGDFNLRKHYKSIIPTPDIFTDNINKYSFFVLASDGLFDVMTNKEIISFIKKNKNKSFMEISKNLTYYAKNKGSNDDITVIIISV